MTARWLPCWLLLLSACAAPPEPLVVPAARLERLVPPPELLACPNLPPVPAAESQRDVATYLVALHAVAEACKRTVDEIRAWAANAR